MKYTLNRTENDLYVFGEKGNEGSRIEISKDFVPKGIVEDYIVEINKVNFIHFYANR